MSIVEIREPAYLIGLPTANVDIALSEATPPLVAIVMNAIGAGNPASDRGFDDSAPP